MNERGVQRSTRLEAAGEVLELGQALFDAIIDAAIAPQMNDAGDAEREPFPLQDARAAADQFFVALRVLLEPQSRPEVSGRCGSL